MTDTEKRIAEIREALEKATPGPWKWIDPGGLERKKLVGEWEIMNFGIGGVYDQVAGSEPDEDDAHLIANAPEWLQFLLDELDRLRAERDSHGPEGRNYTNKQYVDLLMERDKLIEGLHNYMKELDRRYQKAYRNYDIDCDHHQLGMAEAYDVAERRLRDILKEIGVTVE